VRPRRVQTALVLALAASALGCHQGSTVNCPPPPTVTCPDAGAPSFDSVLANVITPVCDRCHAPGGQEAVMPLQTYQQVYGKNGDEVKSIRTQVESCLMPPPNQPEVLTDDGRHLLLTWIACGAPNNPATDGGAGD
jgi:uncharacterized membrane protein